MIESRKIGIIKYKNKEYELRLSYLDGFNSMAAGFREQALLITNEYFYMDEIERRVFTWHELGHLVLTTEDESQADMFAVERTSLKEFETAIDCLGIRVLNDLRYKREKSIFRSYLVYRINAMYKPIIIPKEEKYKIVLEEMYRGDKGLIKINKLYEEMRKKDGKNKEEAC